jgi:hypothetical protein
LPSAEEISSVLARVDLSLGEAWRSEWWGDLMLCEERYFRAFWVTGTAYAAPTVSSATEVFYLPTAKYYQALRAPKLSVLSIERVGSVGTVTTDDAHGLATGDQVWITGAGQLDYTGLFTVTVLDEFTFTCTVLHSPVTPATGTMYVNVTPARADGSVQECYWADCAASYSGDDFAGGVDQEVGDVVRAVGINRFYMCHTAHTTTSVLAVANYGLLTEFERYVDLEQETAAGVALTVIGEVFDVKTANPRATRQWDSLEWSPLQGRIYVEGSSVKVWVEFRKRRPVLRGSSYSASATYAVGAKVLFTPTGGVVNLYECVTATTAGQSPESSAAKWALVEIPKIFEGYMIWSAYAKSLPGEGDAAGKKADAQGMAGSYLDLECDNVYRQQGQAPGIPMRTY